MSGLFDPTTGEVREGGCPECATARRQLVEAEAQLRAVERKLTQAARIEGQLRAELARQRSETPDGKAAHALGRYWIIRCAKNAKTTKLGEKRMKAVIARLRDGYKPEYIARAIDGAAVAATVSQPERERQALIRVMHEAIKRLDNQTAAELRRIYSEAMKGVQRYDDLELICRDETKLERLHDVAEHTHAPTLVGPAWMKEFGAVQEDDSGSTTAF